MKTYQNLNVISEEKKRGGKDNRYTYYIIAICPDCSCEFKTKKNGKSTAKTCLKCSRAVTGLKLRPSKPKLNDSRKILEYNHNKKLKGFNIKLICECGNEYWTTSRQYNDGGSRTCLRCSTKRQGWHKHNCYKEHLYYTWLNMRRRCNCDKGYADKDIKVCDEWNDYLVFKEWCVNNGYARGLTIDRIDNNGDYAPINCRWTDQATQNANKGTAGISGFHGVIYRKDTKKFVAMLKFKGKLLLRQQTNTALEAAQIREDFIKDNNLPHLSNSKRIKKWQT